MPLKIAILASGSGTNAQAMIDKSAAGIFAVFPIGTIRSFFSSSQSSGSGSSTGSVQSDESQWTQAEVDALVAEIKAYAQNKGFTIDSSLGKQGTSYSNPIHAGKDKAKTKADLKENVDFSYQQVVNSLGYFDERATINVFSEKNY